MRERKPLRGSQALLSELSQIENLKTWSLIVSLFGDLDPACGFRLSGKAVNIILAHVGVKAEAVRVALHRLKKVGWVETEKIGREVDYFLSDFGKGETARVYDDIYNPSPKTARQWQMVLHNGTLEEGIRINRNLGLVAQGQLQDHNDILPIDLNQKTLPSWLSEMIVPSEIMTVAQKLSQYTHELCQSDFADNKSDQMAIRLLLLHHWRKLALRESTWAHIALFPDGPLAHCQRMIPKLLKDLPRPHPAHFLPN